MITTVALVVSEVATWMALLPALAVVSHRPTNCALGWIAFAFALSCVADNLARVVDVHLVALVYPVLQAWIIASVFLDRRDGLLFLVVLVCVGVFSVAIDRDIVLRVVAWGSLCGIVVDRWALGGLRTSLLVYFGLGLMAWAYYLWSPDWMSYLMYQSCRAAGLLLFCRTVSSPSPRLVVLRSA